MSSVGGRTPAGRRALRGLPAGASLVEVTIVLGVMALMATMSTPILASAMDAGRARQAAQYLAAQCRHARMHAISSSANAGVVFDRVDGRWRLRRCVDGNGNGVRRADISSGKDSCPEGSVELGELFGGVTIGVDAALPDPDGGAGTSDPVRFGTSDLASFTPTGTATAGTVFVRSVGGAQLAVRVAGVTGRTRVLRFDTGTRRWVEA